MDNNSERNEPLFAQLQRRKVLRSTTIYAVLSWCLLQWCNAFFDSLNWPEWSLSIVLAVVVLGFPVVVAVSWAFELTPTGVHLTERGRAHAVQSPLIRYAVNAAVALAVLATVWLLARG